MENTATETRTVAVLFSDPQLAADLTRRLTQDGFTAITVAGCDELYGVLHQARVDAVVIDARQRGFFTGLDLIERLAADLARPVTLLVGALTAAEQQRAAELKVDQLVSASGDVHAIAEALKATLLVATHFGVLVPPGARALVLRNDAIPPVPQLLIKLANSIDDPTASVADVARDIGTDASTTGELLKLANSAALGLRTRTTRVLDAVTLLGVKGTVALVMSAAVQRVQKEFFGWKWSEFQTSVRLRSLLTAGTAMTFTRRMKNMSPENAQILGLLQDLGMLVLLQAHGERYEQLLRRVRSVGALRLDHSEQQEFGFTHADVSAALLQKWEFPSSIVSLVLDHHRDPSRRPLTEQQLLRAMQIGEAVADLNELPSPQRYHVLSRLLEPFGGVKSDVCRTPLAEAVAWTRESCRLFNLPLPGEAELTEAIERSLQDSPGGDAGVPENDDPSTAATEQMDTQAAHSAPAVLVIEDDFVAVEILTAILGTIGFRVRHCSTTADVQSLVHGVDAVLCDVHLGRESGIDIVRDLRRQGLRAPIIGISSDRTRHTMTRLLDAGIDDFIIKPFNRTVVIDKLRRHLKIEAVSLAPLKLYTGDAVAAVG